MRVSIVGAICAAFVAGVAMAEPIPEKEASRFLFSASGMAVALNPDSGLEEGQIGTIEAILLQLEGAAGANYYGAVVVSPAFFEMMATDPAGAATSGLLQVAERCHSVQAAANVAMRACETARQSGQPRCVIAAQILPKKYKPQPLQLSRGATEAMKDYRKGRGAKALAVSPSTTAWAIGRGEAAAITALTACNAAAQEFKQQDCAVVIED